MKVRDLKDSNGNIIGSISFSDDTPDEIINAKVAEYAVAHTIKIPDVTPRQVRMALLAVGVTEAMIDGVINTLPSPTKEAAMIAWKYSTAFQRNNALIPIVAQMLNYTSADLDNLWITASTL